MFSQFIHNVVGDGIDTDFWEDNWLGFKPLGLYSSFGTLALKKLFLVALSSGAYPTRH